MYTWIWRNLPGGLALKTTQAALLIMAVCALLLFVVFRMRREERPLSDAGAPLDAVVPVGGAGAVAELEVLPEAARR